MLPKDCYGVLAQPMPAVVVGGTCVENVGRCDASGPRLLQCTNGVFTLSADCKGPAGCTTTNNTAECDTSGNSVGDHCAPTSEGKVRCDPVTRVNILKCINGVLVSEYTCPPPTACGVNSNGLTCV